MKQQSGTVTEDSGEMALECCEYYNPVSLSVLIGEQCR